MDSKTRLDERKVSISVHFSIRRRYRCTSNYVAEAVDSLDSKVSGMINHLASRDATDVDTKSLDREHSKYSDIQTEVRIQRLALLQLVIAWPLEFTDEISVVSFVESLGPVNSTVNGFP